MTRKLLALLGLLGALATPTAGWATALCTAVGATPTGGLTYNGLVSVIAAVCLCDGAFDCNPDADTANASWVYDLKAAFPTSSSSLNNKAPDVLILERNRANACGGNLTATFSTGADGGGTTAINVPHTLGSTTAIDSTTTRLVIDLQRATLDRYLSVALTNTAGCDDTEIIAYYVEVER